MSVCIPRDVSRPSLIAVAVCLMLSGCATGGGSVDLGKVETKPIVIKPTPPEPSKDEVVNVPPRDNQDLPRNGFAFKNPTARLIQDKEDKGEGRWDSRYIENLSLVRGSGKVARSTLMNLRAEDSYALDDSGSLDDITLKHATYRQTGDKDKYDVKPVDKTIGGLIPKGSDWSKEGDLNVYPDNDEYKALLHFDHTQMGFISYKHSNHLTEGTLSNATLFYRGINRAHSLPATGNVRYNGHWAYMLPMTYSEAQNGIGGEYVGHNLSAPRSQSAFLAEFDVNFGEKKLNGTLKRKEKDKETPYFNIAANIQGNQFSGKASTLLDKDPTAHKRSEDKRLNQDSDALFGGFYGDKGQELGGAFYTLADKNKPNGDKTMAVAFIAKSDGTAEAARLNNGTLLSWESAPAKAVVSDLGYVDNIKQLGITDKNNKRVVIDLSHKKEQTINDIFYLADACCDNFQFLRLGTLTQADKTADGKPSSKQQESLFVQGELTPVTDVPTSGEARYVGKWRMRTVVHSNMDSSNSDIPHSIHGDAAYKIDFGNKKLSGALVGDGGLTKQGEVHPGRTPYVNINADIKGNQFSGNANMPGSKTVDVAYKPIRIAFDKVEGGLYGPGAAELGGHMTSTDGKSGVVFGGKKQVKAQ